MTQVERLAAFVVRAAYEDLSQEARQQLKIRTLDALGCAIGAMDGPPIEMLRGQLDRLLEIAASVVRDSDKHELRVAHRVMRREAQPLFGTAQRLRSLPEIGQRPARQRPGERDLP